jgi:hypothetical protein
VKTVSVLFGNVVNMLLFPAQQLIDTAANRPEPKQCHSDIHAIHATLLSPRQKGNILARTSPRQARFPHSPAVTRLPRIPGCDIYP